LANKLKAWDNRDFLDLWQETIFIGQEFLTWLWLASEVDNRFELADGMSVEVWFENSLRLESGHGDSKRQLTCQTAKETARHEWAEAFMAVMLAKKVNSGRIRVRTDDREWSMTLPADTLSPKSIKMPPMPEPPPGEAGSPAAVLAGQFLDRVALLAELTGIVEALLSHFLDLRLSPKWTEEELPRLRGWLQKWDLEARGQGFA
jgi:hypothetical protein